MTVLQYWQVLYVLLGYCIYLLIWRQVTASWSPKMPCSPKMFWSPKMFRRPKIHSWSKVRWKLKVHWWSSDSSHSVKDPSWKTPEIY